MAKQRVLISLTPEARQGLREIARKNRLPMSQIVEILIMGNRDTRFVVKAVKGSK